jgi:hypothetical protein
MDSAHNHHPDSGLGKLIALVDEALALSDELGFVFVGIDLSNAAAKLEAMRSAEPDEMSPA